MLMKKSADWICSVGQNCSEKSRQEMIIILEQFDVFWLRLNGIRHKNCLLDNISVAINLLIVICFITFLIIDNQIHHIFETLPILRQLSYIALIWNISRTINHLHYLISLVDLSLTQAEKIRVFKLRAIGLLLFTIYVLGESSNFILISDHVIYKRESGKLEDIIILTLQYVTQFHYIWIANGLQIYSMGVYSVAIYRIHILYQRFRTHEVASATIQRSQNLDKMIRLRCERTKLQSIKHQFNEVLSFWPLIWFANAFISVCLSIVRTFHTKITSTHIFLNKFSIAGAEILSLILVVFLVIYITVYEENTTNDIGDNIITHADSKIDEKIECIKLYQELRATPLVPLTIGNLFNIDRKVMLSFFYSAVPMAIITLNFERKNDSQASK